MLKLELKEKRKIFIFFTILLTVFQMGNLLGRDWITQMTNQQMEAFQEQGKGSPIPPNVVTVIKKAVNGGDIQYFAGQWMIQSFIPFLVFLVLIMGASQIRREKEDNTHYYYLNFLSRRQYLNQKLKVVGILILGWISMSALVSVILIAVLGWQIPYWAVVGGYLVSGIRAFLFYELMLLFSLLIPARGLVTVLAVLVGIFHSAIIQFISPFGKYAWVSGSAAFFTPRILHWEMLGILVSASVIYLLIRRKWETMDL